MIIAGAILAGGEGRRIGGGKALAPLNGRSLVEHVAPVLRHCAEALAVVGDADAAALVAAEAIVDSNALARGPLRGVSAALDWASARGADWLAVAPCDTPLLPRDVFETLVSARGDAAVVCVETADGVQPLVSLWRVDMAAAIRAALNETLHPPVHALLRDLGVVRVRFDAASAFMNVNTPEELARAEALLTQRR